MRNILIVLNYNSISKTKKLIYSVRDYESIDHIIVVDNASTKDKSQDLKEIEGGKVTLLALSENKGYAAGNNAGIQFAIDHFGKDSVLFITNPDVEFTNATIEIINEFMRKSKNKRIGAVAPRMHNGYSAWKFTTFYRNIFLESGIMPRLINTSSLYDRFYKKKLAKLQTFYLKVDVLSGAFFALDAAAFIEINFFDEGTFLYYEEEIIAKKLFYKQYSNYLLTNCEYYHNHNYSKNKHNIQTVKILNESRRYFFINYFRLTSYKKLLLRLSDYINIFIAYLQDKKNA